MNRDDAGGHTLDKEGDMIGEGDKGTNGLGHDKDLCDDALAALACALSPFYWPDGWSNARRMCET
jgi:hypothetical protein